MPEISSPISIEIKPEISSKILFGISDRAQIIPASPIRKLTPYAQRAERRGLKVYHLNIGQPDIDTPSVVIDAIKNIDIKAIKYTDSAGIFSYREALAQYYSLRNREILADEIIITNGGSEAILFSMIATCNPYDEIIIPEPFYANYNSIAVQANVKIVPVSSYIDDGFALPQIEQFEKLITERTKAIIICNPNNPTGYLYTEHELESLKELALRCNLFLIADEVYSDFCYDGKIHHSLLNLEGVDDNIIVLDSVSKRYSMCGSRVGALISRNKQIVEACLKMAQARLCPPLIGQIAAETATRFTPEEYFDSVKKEYVERRNLMVTKLQNMEGVRCPMPAGAFYVMAQIPVDCTEEFAQWLLEEFSYQNATVMIAPANGFYHTTNSNTNSQVRLAYVLNIKELGKALEILDLAIKQYNHKEIK